MTYDRKRYEIKKEEGRERESEKKKGKRSEGDEARVSETWQKGSVDFPSWLFSYVGNRIYMCQ